MNLILTPVIELNNLLRCTTLEYLNANDRNMAIVLTFILQSYSYIGLDESAHLFAHIHIAKKKMSAQQQQ